MAQVPVAQLVLPPLPGVASPNYSNQIPLQPPQQGDLVWSAPVGNAQLHDEEKYCHALKHAKDNGIVTSDEYMDAKIHKVALELHAAQQRYPYAGMPAWAIFMMQTFQGQMQALQTQIQADHQNWRLEMRSFRAGAVNARSLRQHRKDGLTDPKLCALPCTDQALPFYGQDPAWFPGTIKAALDLSVEQLRALHNFYGLQGVADDRLLAEFFDFICYGQ